MMDAFSDGVNGSLYLYVGLVNGVMLRSSVDSVSGQVSDTRTRFLGVRGVKLIAIHAQRDPAVLALSSRPWLGYTFQKRLHLDPVSYELMEFASGFNSEQCPDGIAAICGRTLR